jgi:alkanesulfonate monooxygenase SsuD/methylene tetrahydromethanopterin reductase-like flavin-dependent oxidoreductase (luciferase family)
VPLWVSGRVNERVARRLARFGSGWIPWGEDAADLPTSIPRMREAVTNAGGNADTLQVAGNLSVVRRADRSIDPERTMADVPQLVASGVTDFRAFVKAPETFDEALASLSEIVEVFHGRAVH